MYRANNVFLKKYNKKLIWRLNMSFFLNNIKNKWKKTRWKLQKNLVSNLIFQYNIKNFEYLLLQNNEIVPSKKLPGTISSGSRWCVFIETECTKRPKNYAFLCVKTSCLHFQDAFSFPFPCEASFCVTQTTCFSFAFRNYISPFLVCFFGIYLLSILL
jgi:hypothetical protein